MDSFGTNLYKILWIKYFGIKTNWNKKSCELQSCVTFWDLQLLFWLFLHPRSFPIITHSLMTIERMDSFGINSIKSYDTYLDIQTILIKKFEQQSCRSCWVYNFGINFVFIGHHMRKLWSFSCRLWLLDHVPNRKW